MFASETVGIANETPADNYSIKSLKWLKYVLMNEIVNIQHACSLGEYCLNINRKRYRVDGYCKETNTIYQFYGCFYHVVISVTTN